LTRKLGVPATTRASFYLYNTTADIDALVEGITSAQKYFG
jgi:cysteine desulfurase / selenocysteine lyase